LELEQKTKSKSTFREYAEAIGMALLLALFIRTFIVQAFKIPSGSMIRPCKSAIIFWSTSYPMGCAFRF